jgi:hypothetical protein
MKKITFLALLLIFSIFSGFSQEILVNDFEPGFAAPLDDSGQLILEVVANPDPTGLNTTANVLKISRTATKRWWDYVGIDVADMTINAAEIKYLSVMLYYQGIADIGIRFDAPSDTDTGVTTVRPLNAFDYNLNEWQELVFEIKDGPDAFAFTKGTLYRLTLHPDIGDQPDDIDNIPSRNYILDGTEQVAYFDQFRILDENPLATASVNDASLEDAFSIYPSAVSSTFTIKTTKTISNMSIFNILGKDVSNNVVALGNESYDISTLSSGMYIVKIASENGNFITKKIIKE